jgi:hypothetical protein
MRRRLPFALAALAAAVASLSAPARAQAPPLMPDGCAVWFDGCNRCTRDDDGIACTKKFCTELKPARCLRWIGGARTMPKDCAVWFDGCNTCRRSASGTMVCTRRYCSQSTPPRCIRRTGETQR